MGARGELFGGSWTGEVTLVHGREVGVVVWGEGSTDGGKMVNRNEFRTIL